MSVLKQVGGNMVESHPGSRHGPRVRLTRYRALMGWTACACVLLGGCGSGEYARRMNETSTQLKKLGDIAKVLYPTLSPVKDAADAATGIQLRLPLVIDGSAKAMHGDDPAAQPPSGQLPGLAYSYEMQVGGQPAYAYFAAVAGSDKTQEAFAQEVQTALGSAFSGAVWVDTQLETPDGRSITLKLLSATGKQKFGQDVQDGRFDLYLVSSGTHHVVIGWRAPVAAGAGFFDNAAASMGSVQGNV